MNALIDLVLSGRVDEEVAANAATNRHDFLVGLEAAKKHKVADEREAEEAAAAAARAEAERNGQLGVTLRAAG
jgi:hypothetical protein